ncbi:MAG: HD domain-containing phosphohydrolase [Desulfococcaceae bacterium]|jgi:HD-GYP domain-containing protein (c-di-GMP phosphodiesterase class II)|nr:HD domain-containing phosphohydrolase [Desulfococcaceae bacterium]
MKHRNSDTDFFPASAKAKDRLRREKAVPASFSVYSHPDMDIGGPEGQKAENPPRLQMQREEIYEKMADCLRDIFDCIRKNQQLDIRKAEKLAAEALSFTAEEDPLFIRAIHHDSVQDYYIYHCVNTAVYVVKIAECLKRKHPQKTEMVLTALLHDVALADLPDALMYEEEEKFTDAQRKLLKKRPLQSREILMTLGKDYARLAECAAQIHERLDGSGYPNGLKGDAVHEYAQIIGLAAMYEGMTHSRPGGKKYPHSSAMKKILQTEKKTFRKEYLKALLKTFSFFPLHSYVRLNSGAVGRVVETHPDHPLSPKIRVLHDAQMRDLPSGRLIDLRENSVLHIVKSISKEEAEALQ